MTTELWLICFWALLVLFVLLFAKRMEMEVRTNRKYQQLYRESLDCLEYEAKARNTTEQENKELKRRLQSLESTNQGHDVGHFYKE